MLLPLSDLFLGLSFSFSLVQTAFAESSIKCTGKLNQVVLNCLKSQDFIMAWLCTPLLSTKVSFHYEDYFLSNLCRTLDRILVSHFPCIYI